MLSIKIIDIKFFMNKLLCSDMFDHFLMPKASITTFIHYDLDGTNHNDFYSDEDDELIHLSDCPFVPFSKIKQHCFELMKEKHSPISFKFIFMLSEENLKKTLDSLHSHLTKNDISGIYINLNYQNKQLLCTTGISYKTFTADKSLDMEWDRLIKIFLKNHGIIWDSF